ncbi:MAG: lipopolysaccharide heptosyltransferase II [Planctomycetota bacterium]
MGQSIATPARVLCRLPTWVGDAVMAVPALRALRQRYPQAQLLVQGRKHLRALLEGDSGDDPATAAPLFDDFLPDERGNNHKIIAAAKADLAVILPHSFRAALEVFRGRVPVRIGYATEGRTQLLTHSLTPARRGGQRFPVPMVLQYLELVGVVGALGDGRGPTLSIPAEVAARGAASLQRLGVQPDDRLVGFNPGASFGPSKIWPAEYVAATADHYQRAGYRAAVLCGPGEEDLAREIEAQMETTPINTADAVLPLDELKVALARCELVITTDTGPRHMATSLGVPTVCLMGSTDPRYTNSHLGPCIVLQKDVPCGPCHLKVCPYDHHRCMREILPAEVIAAGDRVVALRAVGRND